ncbi:hypothetical protein [Pseudonocardia acaciae]|uniref:hypothetical protein n=1 Tax=Pseudonocardia acaciae TaxID=551276 RepID=UPI00048E6138|nr:hypothetical protein [Pseudonocardia acaciae]
MTTPLKTRPAHPGPPLAAPAIAFVVLFIAPGFFGGAGGIPSPFGPTATVHAHFAANLMSSQLNGFMMFLSAVFLVLFSALALSRLTYLAPNAPGPTIAGVGGVVAGVLLAVSALVGWVLGQPVAVEQPGLTHVLHFLSFVLGGPGHVAALGLLVFGLAITSWFLRRAPRWLCVVGFVIAAVSVLSSVSLVVTPAAPLIPLGRFTGMAWLVAISFLIPRERAARREGN